MTPDECNLLLVLVPALLLGGCVTPDAEAPTGPGVASYEGCPGPYPDGSPAPCSPVSIQGTISAPPTGWLCTSSTDLPALKVAILRDPLTGRLGVQYDQREIPGSFVGLAAVPDGASFKLTEWPADSPAGFVEIPSTSGSEVLVMFHQASLSITVKGEPVDAWNPIWSMWGEGFWLDLLVENGARTFSLRPTTPFAVRDSTFYGPSDARWNGPDFEAAFLYRTTGILSLLADGANVCPGQSLSYRDSVKSTSSLSTSQSPSLAPASSQPWA
jgi:hypothetical protein